MFDLTPQFSSIKNNVYLTVGGTSDGLVFRENAEYKMFEYDADGDDIRDIFEFKSDRDGDNVYIWISFTIDKEGNLLTSIKAAQYAGGKTTPRNADFAIAIMVLKNIIPTKGALNAVYSTLFKTIKTFVNNHTEVYGRTRQFITSARDATLFNPMDIAEECKLFEALETYNQPIKASDLVANNNLQVVDFNSNQELGDITNLIFEGKAYRSIARQYFLCYPTVINRVLRNKFITDLNSITEFAEKIRRTFSKAIQQQDAYRHSLIKEIKSYSERLNEIRQRKEKELEAPIRSDEKEIAQGKAKIDLEFDEKSKRLQEERTANLQSLLQIHANDLQDFENRRKDLNEEHKHLINKLYREKSNLEKKVKDLTEIVTTLEEKIAHKRELDNQLEDDASFSDLLEQIQAMLLAK